MDRQALTMWRSLGTGMVREPGHDGVAETVELLSGCTDHVCVCVRLCVYVYACACDCYFVFVCRGSGFVCARFFYVCVCACV